MTLPKLNTLGIIKADRICQEVIAHTKPVAGPAARSDKLDDLGVPDGPAIIVLVNRLVAATKSQGATLDPATLNNLSPATTFGAMEDIVKAAPLDAPT
jgi:hypothetical protein